MVASTGRDFNFTHAKATRDFGYEPSVPLEQAIAETTEWLKANQHTFDACCTFKENDNAISDV
ncbi:MAG: hypothetical protein U0559_09310 [Anaerolineae bacterium]